MNRSLDQKTMLRPTTKDLAKSAGVSRATVDRVLNGREGVRQETVDRVNKAIAELGFVRNLQAANLARSQNYRFVFALPRSGDQFLDQIILRIQEAETLFSADHVWCDVHHIDENDPHSISAYLSSLSKSDVAGVAIMSPESPQVRDAITRLQERGVAALPLISNQTMMDADWVGIDNRAAGATAGLLMGKFVAGRRGTVMVIAESMQSRDSLERRLGFDHELCENFPELRALPSLETYGSADRARTIISASLQTHPDVVGIYVVASEARSPLSIVAEMDVPRDVIRIAHERTPFTEQALRDRTLDGVIAQDAGHLVRSAIRRLKGIVDRRKTLGSQEQIRIEILLRTNI
ncbi:LacI family DNA-binding transcriptional regulator [Yoonia sp. 72]|uniref:LacI family DNA-binding transcriptional regulator n=1 Tax=unclassified Yoonia TaxID=2629118 RepID=UPI003A4C7649